MKRTAPARTDAVVSEVLFGNFGQRLGLFGLVLLGLGSFWGFELRWSVCL